MASDTTDVLAADATDVLAAHTTDVVSADTPCPTLAQGCLGSSAGRAALVHCSSYISVILNTKATTLVAPGVLTLSSIACAVALVLREERCHGF